MTSNNFFYVKCVDRHDFFRRWVKLLTPWHNLTAREQDVFARLIEQYYILKEKIDDEDLLFEFLWSNSSRKDIRESLGMTQAHFQMILASLRKSGVLKDDRFEPRFLPHFTDQPRLGLYIAFDWSSVDNPVSG